MTRRAQVIHLVLFLAGLIGLSRSVTGSFLLPTGDASIWFHAGLLMLILGMYWIEPYFTKPSDVVINGLVVFISTSTLTDPPYESWWNTLRYFSLIVVVVAFLVVWAGSPAVAGNDTSRFKRIVYLIVIRIGNATVLFSATFLLALFSYFDSRAPMSRWMLAFWVVLVVTKNLDLEGLIRSIGASLRTRSTGSVGRLSRFAEPNIARFMLRRGADCARGTLVAFTKNATLDDSSPLAVVVAHRTGLMQIEAETILVDSKFAEGAVEQRQVVIKLDPSDPVVRERLSRNIIGADIGSLVGFAWRESDISRLRVELRRNVPLEEGHLVAAPSLSGSPILFQVINGFLFEETSLESGERMFTVADAQQLGTWDTSRQGFSSHSWVVPENAPVLRHTTPAEFQRVLKQGLVDVGQIPGSLYPVNINLSELVLFHSAILGVTGSGKSFLAYFLIEIVPFLADPDSKIGIVEFTEAGTHPITATKTITQIALDWCRTNRTPEEIRDPKPKVLLVLEEAHSLVPEWNSNPVPNLRDTVNATAQLALQARKFGLGLMVITQRTANVTKSILNQCNTIFAFQAYDETGFEFMKNYMGLHYVQALPNLKKRQGVIVGKASASDRPIIVRFHDQDRQPSAVEMPAYIPRRESAEPPTGGRAN
jgi:hypothetical protein